MACETPLSITLWVMFFAMLVSVYAHQMGRLLSRHNRLTRPYTFTAGGILRGS
ncbi:MAG: hypothetical protein VW554_08105 [Alphaproteobacteria bacterium]